MVNNCYLIFVAFAAMGCDGANAAKKMDVCVDLSVGLSLDSAGWPKADHDKSMWELPINSGTFILRREGGRQLVCRPERAFVGQRDGVIDYFWIVFPKSDKDRIVELAKELCKQMDIPSGGIVSGIEAAEILPSSARPIYEKNLQSDALKQADLDSVSLDVPGTYSEAGPLRLHWKIFLPHADSDE